MAKVNIKDKLALDTFKVAKESHLKVDQGVCNKCDCRCCLSICPAGVYTVNEAGEIRVDFEACLECGTCLIACPHDAIQWSYPQGGYGVQLKYG
ncbi:MAG: 4Fe-4S dicluster domain-containing protein [Chloroflexota bacterium]